LEAAVAWSYDLLADDERALFDSMAVFADGCLLDGIAFVGGLDEYDALDVLDRLVARLMVTAQTTPLGTRYRQLETLRQFAEARLVEQGRLAQARDRHLAWVSTLCAAVGSAARTPGAAAAFVRYCAEVDNIRAAVAHGAATGQRETALRSLADTWSGHCRRPTFEVRGWIDPVAGTPPWTAAAAEVAGLHGLIAFLEGDFERTRELVAAVPAEFAALRTVATMAWMYEHFVLGNSDAAEALILQPSTGCT
jgi:predicted ATPase